MARQTPLTLRDERPRKAKGYKVHQIATTSKAYLKAKSYIEAGLYELVDLKKRQPHALNKFYFRVTKKYRAFGYISKEGNLIVTDISDHQ